jgi:hypothetical protein
MPSTYTLNNGIELIGTGEQSGTWGDTTNTNLGLLDAALDGQVTVALASAGSSGSPNSLPITDGTASNGRNRMVVFSDSGDLGATAYVQLTPNDAEKIIYIRNSLSGSRSVILFQGTYNASNDYEVPAGTTAIVYFDGAGAGAVAANVFNNAYFDGLRLGSVSVTAILDEDNMASDSATALATQQSIKAYVDSQVGTVDTLAEILAIGNTTGATDIAVDSAQKVQFRDAAIYINSSVDGQLDIVADTEIQIAATTIDVNGALDVSETALVTGVLTTTAATVSNGGGQFNGAINVGVDDTGYDVKFFGATTGKSLLWDESADSLIVTGTTTLVGTTNLDAVDIDGATQIDATVTVGVDDTGYDVKFFGATAGAYMLWDESADDLILGGAAGLSVNSTALVTGVLTTTAATVFNGGFTANADSTLGTDKKVQFRDAAIYINSSVDGQLDIVADTEIQIAATTVDLNGNLDVSGTLGVTGVATFTSTPVFTDDIDVRDNIALTSDAARITFGADSDVILTHLPDNGIQLNTNMKMSFRDSNIYVHSSADGQLDLIADTEIQISATTVDLNGNLDVSGTALVTGVLTTTAATVSNGGGQFNGAINVGVDDTGYDVKLFGATTGKSLLWDESADSLIVTGSTSLQGGLEVGVDDTGYDVKFFGATTGKSLLWDESADSLTVAGNLSVDGGTIKLDGNYPVGTDNVALGNAALDSVEAGGTYNVAIGASAGTAITTGAQNTAIGDVALTSNTTASNNVAVGSVAMNANTTGGNNVAVGTNALRQNSTASNNTAVGYQAGYSNQTGLQSVFVGEAAGYLSTGNYNTYVGGRAAYNATTAVNNSFFGNGSGSLVTSGSKNTIVGTYDGNSGGLDIRTSSNNIVLSDGDGNPRVRIDEYGEIKIPGSVDNPGTSGAVGMRLLPEGFLDISRSSAQGINVNRETSDGGVIHFFKSGSQVGTISVTASSTAYATSSDYRLKENVVYDWDATTRLKQLKPARFNFIVDADTTVDGFLAHEAQEIVPECVTGTKDAVDADGVAVMQGIDQSKLVPLLVKTIQELEARITALEGN